MEYRINCFTFDFRYDPKYLVIATDGIWDVLSDQEVIDSINEYSNDEEEDVAKKISRDAISWYSHDNIAILIIYFEKKGGSEEEEDDDDDDDEDGNEIEELPMGKHDELWTSYSSRASHVYINFRVNFLSLLFSLLFILFLNMCALAASFAAIINFCMNN